MDPIVSLVDPAMRISRELIKKEYIHPMRRIDCVSPEPPVPFAGAVPESVAIALELYKENKAVFDPAFVGDIPTKARGDPSLHYVSYLEFCKQMDCAVDMFLRSLDASRSVELWIPCFSEQTGFCFAKSNIWAALLALPKLAPRLDRVRIENFGAKELEYGQWLPNDQNLSIVFVDDGIYSGMQFDNVVKPLMDWLAQKQHTNVQIDVIAPYISPMFLLRTGTPESVLALEQGRDDLREHALKHTEVASLMQGDVAHWEYYVERLFLKRNPLVVLSNWLDREDRETGKREVTEQDLLKFMQQEFPQVQDPSAAARYFFVSRTKGWWFSYYMYYSLHTLMWKRKFLRVHNTIIMDCRPTDHGKFLTSFFFAHKVPDGHSSMAGLTVTAKVIPPYRRHAWSFRGVSLDFFKTIRHIDTPDLIEYFKSIPPAEPASSRCVIS